MRKVATTGFERRPSRATAAKWLVDHDAGGASCAAHLRRLDEDVEVIMVERGRYVSYANCGLPYYDGGVIPDESELLVATAEDHFFTTTGQK